MPYTNRIAMSVLLAISVVTSSRANETLFPEVEWTCPIANADKPTLRPGDACAKEGGGFTANRGSGNLHQAVDINTTLGANVRAIAAGTVILANGNWGHMGKTVIIEHPYGQYSVYGHLAMINVKEGASVGAGDSVGTVGFSGNSKCLEDKKLSPHLHLAYFKAGKAGIKPSEKPLSSMKAWGDFWIQEQDVQFMGVRDPVEAVGPECW